MRDFIRIGDRRVGGGAPVLVIAEAGVNHNGDLATAMRLIDSAVEAKADAVKFQTFRAEELATAGAPKAEYQSKAGVEGGSQLEMLESLQLPLEAFGELHDYCRKRGIVFLSTPFDRESADFLDSLGMPAFKVPSGELTNDLHLEHLARKGKPLIVSTGMAMLGEVEAAMDVIERTGNDQVSLLHCVSNYPADPADVNLRAMTTMEHAFRVPVGYSDHTLGIEIALAAIALGACIIEKHFTLDRDQSGPDHAASLEPDELRAMVRGIRAVESALGDGRKKPAASEAGTAAVARRTLVAARDIGKGEEVVEEMIALQRSGRGLPPSIRRHIVGRVARIDIRRGEVFSLEMFR